MARVKTFTAGGSLLPGDLNSIEDDYEAAYGHYKLLIGDRGMYLAQLNGSGVYPLVASTAAIVAIPNSASLAVYLDPADLSATPRAVKYRLKAMLVTNQAAPGVTFTFGLYPVTFSSGSANNETTITAGTVTPGSTVAFATPGASNGGAQNNSGDFSPPIAGWYVPAVSLSGTTAANSVVSVRALLQYRQV